MVPKLKLNLLLITTLMLVSLFIGIVEATTFPGTQKTTNITINSGGTFNADEPGLGIAYKIEGTPGATGTVTAIIHSANPQPTASSPQGVELNKFIVVTFNMEPNEFELATVTFTYTDEDVENLQSPYVIYKYLPQSNSYIEMPTVINAQSKTLTVVLTSVDDPLLAVGGLALIDTTADVNFWLIIAVIAVIIIVAIALIVLYMYRSGRIG